MEGRRKALIVANGEYENAELGHLRSPAADATALAEVLGDPDIGGFEVAVVRDEPTHVVQGHIEDLFTDSRRDDLLLLHFSCHGLKSDSGELFFAMRNTRPDRLGSTAVPAEFVQRCIRGSRARSVVLLLDCCYGGAYGRGVVVRSAGEAAVLDSFPQQGLGSGRGRAVITASSAIEYAFEGGLLADDQAREPSVFTSALVRGLRTGEADRDEDGHVSLNELYDYVFDQVRERNPHQTPSRDIEMQGELYLARSRRRRIRPAPMPPDLEAAIRDANMYSRVGAIGELRARLASANLPAAVGAYEALVEIARTDIGHVAELAEEASRTAVLHPDVTAVDFGPVPVGTPRPHQRLQLLGPPIAQACVPETSEDWLRVTLEGPVVDIVLDTDVPGPRQGRVVLRGPTGEVVVTVGGEVVAIPVQTRRVEEEQVAAPPPTASEPTTADEPDAAQPPPGPPAAEKAGEQVAGTAAETAAPVRKASRAWSVLWALVPVISLGLLAPVPAAHAAYRLRSVRLALSAALYAAALVTALALPADGGSADAVSGLLLVTAGVAATVQAFLVRGRVFAVGGNASPSEPGRSHPSPAAAPGRSGVPAEADEQALPILQLVTLGVAGSGKTVLLSSMFHTAHVPTPDRPYFLETDAAHRVFLSRVFDEVADTAEPWPRGTRVGESRTIGLDCVSYREGVKHAIFRLGYLDYAGELLDSEPEAGSTALGALERSIASAHGLLGILDGHRVLQYLRNEPEGRRYLRSTLQPMIGIMAGATCPIHFALTKWDLVHGFGEPADADDAVRLSLVREALLSSQEIRSLVETHGYGGLVVRLIPVSATGPDFATVDGSGHVVKQQGARVRPCNVDVPLAAVLPDLFGQLDLSLEPALAGAAADAARTRARASAEDAERALAMFQLRPAGQRLRQALEQRLGPQGGALAGMFLDWKGLALGERPADRPGPSAGEARARIVAHFCSTLERVEAELPASRLSAGG